jgi:hypothetical protein
MNDLILSMSTDMGITPYIGEDQDSFAYRTIYSALGMWCLWTAKSSTFGKVGSTKQSQTIVLNELLKCYEKLYPNISSKFNPDNSNVKFSVHFRRVYEETGYLLTDENSRNRLARYGRCIQLGTNSLYFGIPDSSYTVNGLGIFTFSNQYPVTSREFLLRDNLSLRDFVIGKYNIAEFYEKEFESEGIKFEFFNPLSNKPISQSWHYQMVTDFSIARNVEQNIYYRVIRETNGKILFADEHHEINDELTSYDYRRLYYALKAYYRNPSLATIKNLDSNYAKLTLSGHLPNREYYFLLLISWPVQNVFDKISFLTRREFIPEITNTLNHLGIEVRGK